MPINTKNNFVLFWVIPFLAERCIYRGTVSTGEGTMRCTILLLLFDESEINIFFMYFQ